MDEFKLNFTLKGFQERNVILENPHLGQMLWPIKKFPDDIQKGDQISIGILNKNYLSKENQIKDALKELL
jgi:hypothetical protein